MASGINERPTGRALRALDKATAVALSVARGDGDGKARCGCGHWEPRPRNERTGPAEERPVQILARKNRVTISGTWRCRSVWECPLCAHRVARRNLADLELARVAWLQAGGTVLLVTATAAHDLTDDLRTLCRSLSTAWRRVWQGKVGQKGRKRLAVEGTVRALEITWGRRNGWHPHFHIALFVRGKMDAAGCAAWERWISQRWCRYLTRPVKGAVALRRPSDERAVKVSATWAIGYLAKQGLAAEVTGAENKAARGGNLAPRQLLRRARLGKPWAAVAWNVYARATRRLRCLVWSHGLRKRLAGHADAEIPPANVLAEVAPQTWNRLTWSEQEAYRQAWESYISYRAPDPPPSLDTLEPEYPSPAAAGLSLAASCSLARLRAMLDLQKPD